MTFSFLPFSADAFSSDNFPLELVYDSNVLIDGARPYGADVETLLTSSFATPFLFFGPKNSFEFSQDAEYTLSLFAAARKSVTSFIGKMEIYIVGSAFPTSNPLGQLITTYKIDADLLYLPFPQTDWNFTAPADGIGYLRFVVYGAQWHISDVSLKPATEFGYTPDEIELILPINGHKFEHLQFNVELYDVNNNLVNIDIETDPLFFDGGSTMLKGPTSRVDGQIQVAPSGSGGAVITTLGYTDRFGIFQPGATAIYLGAGQHANQNTPFLVASASAGPVFSVADKIVGFQSGSQFIVTMQSSEFSINTPTFQLQSTDTGSPQQNVIKLGTSASAISLYSGSGFYTDGTGQIRLGSSTGSTSEYLLFDQGGLSIHANSFILETNTININSTINSGTIALFSASAFSTGLGIWADGLGRFRVGDPAGQRIAFDNSALTLSSSVFDFKSQNVAISSENSGSFLLIGTSSAGSPSHILQGGSFAFDIFTGSIGSIIFSLNQLISPALTVANITGGLEVDYIRNIDFYIRDLPNTGLVKVWSFINGIGSGTFSASVPASILTAGSLVAPTGSFNQLFVSGSSSMDFMRHGYMTFQLTGSSADETHFRPIHSSSRFILPVGTNLYATQ